jgi:hypothetical protein
MMSLEPDPTEQIIKWASPSPKLRSLVTLRYAKCETLPLPEVDYPRTFQEMDNWFRSEAGCRDYVRWLRWPKGFVCRRWGPVSNGAWGVFTAEQVLEKRR